MQFETLAASEQGRRAQLDEDLRAEVRVAFDKLPDMEEFWAHLNAFQEKVEEDHGAVQWELGLLRDVARESATASAVTGFSPQAFAASAAAGQKLHLTQRKGFEGLATYGGGAQWQDWRFTTVDWIRQENADFEGLLKKIERLTEEPEEPAEGTDMSLEGVALTAS